jgi:hypothetical protein
MSCSAAGASSAGSSSHCSPSASSADAASRNTQSESLAQSPTTAERLSTSPTAVESATDTPTLAQSVQDSPTPTERLAQEPTTAERLTCEPARPDLAGPIVGNRGLSPEADYRDGVGPAEFNGALAATAAHACRQWAAGQGVVGPMGQEDRFPFGGYNDPSNENYALRQQFGFHHDMQATDAELQHGTEPGTFDGANAASALRGFTTLNRTGDIHQALEAARAEWAVHGFEVYTRY